MVTTTIIKTIMEKQISKPNKLKNLEITKNLILSYKTDSIA